jgi:hypothetical protein
LSHTARQVRPLHCPERVRDYRVLIAGRVDNDRQEERLLLGHVMCTLGCELPFMPKITLEALLSVLRDNRNEQDAVMDLASDLLIPRIPTSQLALIEKDLDAGGAQGLANPLRGLLVL